MKKLILLSIALLFLAACKKEEKVAPKAIAPVVTATTTTTPVAATKPDTIPDQAVFMIRLIKDSTNYDETMFVFNHTSSLDFSPAEDAPYFAGNGQESLASFSNDGQGLAVNTLPYQSGMSIALDVNAKTSGAYTLKLSYINKIPSSISVWVKDTYKKDSVDMRNVNCNFKIDKADADSFGSKRFKIILKQENNKQTGR